MDLKSLEEELVERTTFPYIWGRLQDDNADKKTNFIYNAKTLNELIFNFDDLSDELINYAYNRWFNFWSAQASEYMFSLNEKVIPEKNKKHKLIDFRIEGTPFDLKGTVFPKAYPYSIEYAKSNPLDLILWLYTNQSKEGRGHYGNRLFIVFYNSNLNEHWKVKSNLTLINEKIDIYLNNYNLDNLPEFIVRGKLSKKESLVKSDIIWIEI